MSLDASPGFGATRSYFHITRWSNASCVSLFTLQTILYPKSGFECAPGIGFPVCSRFHITRWSNASCVSRSGFECVPGFGFRGSNRFRVSRFAFVTGFAFRVCNRVWVWRCGFGLQIRGHQVVLPHHPLEQRVLCFRYGCQGSGPSLFKNEAARLSANRENACGACSGSGFPIRAKRDQVKTCEEL